MLRVAVQYFDTHITLKVEGKLKGSWVGVLERCWLTLELVSKIGSASA